MLNCIFLDWDEKTELKELSECHVGIMPLHDSEWELGKCGYKILQYMALKLPVIASPIGVNKEIITNNYNGLFANSIDEWYSKILHLKDNPNFRNKIGHNGYITVKEKFNLKMFENKYSEVIGKIYDFHYK